MVGWLLEGLFRKRWQAESRLFLWVLLFYVVWNTFAAAISARPLHSLWSVADNEWPLFIMVMTFWIVQEKATLIKITYAFLVTSSLNAVYGIWQSLEGVELYRNLALDPEGVFYRAVGFQGFYLTFAGFAMASFLMSTAYFLVSSKTLRIWMAFLSVTSLMAIIGTFARSIWLATVATAPVLGFIKGRKAGVAFAGGFLSLAVVSLIFFQPLRSRAESMFDMNKNETRLNLWKTTLRISTDYPITGIGQDNFDYYFEKYRVEGFYDTTVHPHNDYLNVLVSSGVPGVMSFIILWFLVLREGFRTFRLAIDRRVRALSLGASLSIVGFLIGGLFQNYYGTFANCLEWWFLTGVVFTCSKFVDSKRREGHLGASTHS